MSTTCAIATTPSVGEPAGVESSKSDGEFDFHKGIALSEIIGNPYLVRNSIWNTLPAALLAGAYAAAVEVAELKDPWCGDIISANEFLKKAEVTFGEYERADFVVAMQFAKSATRKAAFKCEGAGGFVPKEEVLESIFVAEGFGPELPVGWRIASGGYVLDWQKAQKYWQ